MTGARKSVDLMLHELGYDKSRLAAFQRDYNRMGTDPVLVTGELDADTEDAIRLAHGARAVFTSLRDCKKGA